MRLDVRVNIFRAQSGKMITSQVFKGTTPRYCQQRESVFTIYGESVDYETVYDWVWEFVTEKLP